MSSYWQRLFQVRFKLDGLGGSRVVVALLLELCEALCLQAASRAAVKS
jgi:hypothetical protein